MDDYQRIAFYKKKKFIAGTIIAVVVLACSVGYLKYSKKLWFKADTVQVNLVNTASVSSGDTVLDTNQVQIQYTP